MKAYQKEYERMSNYQFPMYQRLEPVTPWQVSRVADTDVLSLDDAAKFASQQAGTEILPADFLRAASRGEMPLKAIVHHRAKLKKHDGGIYCNQGLPTENTVPEGAIPTLPLSACQHLANAGRASWRTFDGFELIEGVLMRFSVATLEDGEPDFETVPTDCRVMGWDARALAEAYMNTPETTAAAPSGTPESDSHQEKPWISGVDRNERGCRRMILENWPDIKKLHGSNANGLQVLRILKRKSDPSEKMPVLKTVQNKLKELRDENKIP